MPDLLKVSSPLPSQEANKIRPPVPGEANKQVQHIPNPQRVAQTNSQTVNTEREAARFLPNFESNYDRFIQLLRSTGDSMSLYKELFFNSAGLVVNSGMSEGITKEIAAFMNLIQMTESELASFVQAQVGDTVKFDGPFFNMLLDVFNNTISDDLQYSILDMLKKYDSHSSSGHIFNELLTNLDQMIERMPKSAATELQQLIGQLKTGDEAGQNSINLSILKNSILPFLSQYVSSRGDFGTIRDAITLFTLNLARFESGSTDSFIQSFRELLKYDDVANRLSGIDINELEKYLLSGNKPISNEAVNRLVEIISRGVGGEAGIQNKGDFENIMRSILVNESVYMPLLHVMVPANVNGTMMFSEMWVDPDAEGHGGGSLEERAVKVMVKFDIKNVGYFELIALSKNSDVDLQLYFPESFESQSFEIRQSLRNILDRNGLTMHELFMDVVTRPKTISEVFPKIHERKNAIDVVV